MPWKHQFINWGHSRLKSLKRMAFCYQTELIGEIPLYKGTVHFWTSHLEIFLFASEKYANLIYFHYTFTVQVQWINTNMFIDAPKELQQDTVSGVKCIKVSPDGLYIGAGEKGGSVRIYDLRSMKQIYHIPVHSGEVLQVDFSPDIVNFPSLMASGGKDRTVQVYTIDDNFSHLQTLSAHSGAVTCMQFYSKSHKDTVPTLYLISCATDRSIKLFLYSILNGSFEMKHHIVNNTSIYGMDIDSVRQRLAVAGQDKHVRFYSLEELSTRSIGKISGTGEEKGFSHLAFDPSGRYLVTSSVQKYVLLFDTYSKAFLSHVYGHSEMILGVRFSQDGRYFVSVGGDGCIFVWRLPSDVTQLIHKHIGYKETPPETHNVS